MRIGFNGSLTDENELRVGFIGCGSHSFRNIYPTFQFVPVKLTAVCDLSLDKAKAYAAKFGASGAYSDYSEMLEKEKLDAVFVVTGYDTKGRPLYPKIAVDCLNAGCHVWIEKPPAASTADIEKMQEASARNKKNVLVGLKKMFFPANEKAKELANSKDFGNISLVMTQYPQSVPTVDEFDIYSKGNPLPGVTAFLDHICHPMSLILYLMGMPESFYYERSFNGAGTVTFKYASGAIVSLALTAGSSKNGGMERTTILSDTGKHIVVNNNIEVSLHQDPPNLHYGVTPSYYTGDIGQTTAVWQPEFSLGQLYNKGLFLLGYYNEVNEFAQSILAGRAPVKGTLEQAWQITRIFELFAEGPGKTIKCR